MRGSKRFSLILVVFLISVGVLEFILWKDGKRRRDPVAKDDGSAEQLLQLLRAIEHETPRTIVAESSPEYNRESAGTK